MEDSMYIVKPSEYHVQYIVRGFGHPWVTESCDVGFRIVVL